MEDRSLRQVVTGLGGSNNAPIRETGFDIVTASEIMAVLALAADLDDLRARLGRIVVGFTNDNTPVTASDIDAVGSMMSLLRYAIQPNLVQTGEGQPVMIHAGPFGNIAHGCNSVVADRMALGYADYVVTEAGFGADLGFEKFMHIKARFNDLEPHAAVLVASVRALKSHGGVPLRQLEMPDVDAVKRGLPNLQHLIGMIKSFGLPVVVAMNYFPSDTEDEMAVVKECAESMGATAAESRGFTEGGPGCVELAQALIDATDGPKPSITYAYAENDTIEDKVNALSRVVYGADGAQWAPTARRALRRYEDLGWGQPSRLHGQDPPLHLPQPLPQGTSFWLHLRGLRRTRLRGRRLHLPPRRLHGHHAGPSPPPHANSTWTTKATSSVSSTIRIDNSRGSAYDHHRHDSLGRSPPDH